MSRSSQAIRRILGWLVRGSLVALWALAGWGTLLLLATAFGVLSDGLGVALGRLVPAPGASMWSWLNGVAALLALLGWMIAGGLFAWGRWFSEEAPEPQK
jgi:hypothetical protein